MIKLSANLSKKIPVPGIEYSSQQFGASMEIEASTGESPDFLRQRIRQLYTILAGCVEEQIAAAGAVGDAAQHASGSRQQEAQYSNAPAPMPSSVRSGTLRPSAPARTAAPPATHSGANGGRSAGNGHGRRGGCTQAQQRAIAAICRDRDIDLAAVLAECRVSDIKHLDVRAASELIDRLKGGEVGAGNGR